MGGSVSMGVGGEEKKMLRTSSPERVYTIHGLGAN
jgi:hypothetical protein